MLRDADQPASAPSSAATSDDVAAPKKLSDQELQVALAVTGPGPITSPAALAASLDIHPSDFLAILARPHVKAWIEASDAAERERHARLAERAKAEAIEILSKIARDEATEPIERRRAAGAIVRALRPPRPSRPPEPQPERPAQFTRPPRDLEAEAARELRLQQDALWSTDAAALRARYDFATAEAAVDSVGRIITTADPEDPEAALMALFLLTEFGRNMSDPPRFFRCVRYLMGAAGGYVSDFESVETAGIYQGFRLSLQPKVTEAEPLDVIIWVASPGLARPYWCLVAIVPWAGGEGLKRRIWHEHETGFEAVAPEADKPP